MKNRNFSTLSALRAGWQLSKQNWQPILLAVIATISIQVVASLTETYEHLLSIPAYFGMNTLLYAASFIVSVGLLKLALKIIDEKKVKPLDLFDIGGVWFRYLVASAAYLSLVVAGTILFIVPGVIAALRFSQYGYLVIEKNLKADEALRESWIMTRGHTGDLLFFFIIIGLLNLYGILTIVGVIVTIPIAALAGAHIYRQLGAASEPAETTGPAQISQADLVPNAA
ncbi:MAG: hypothetical protein AAB360_01260 [Patescibacteria group bacterium]